MLQRSLYLSAGIILANLAIGINAPTTVGLDDEIMLLDGFWRVAQGQRPGIDYHDPFGFGPAYLGAALLNWLGPHYYVFRLTAALIGLSIAVCGCIVAKRGLGHSSELGLLFCVMLAFTLSAPSVFGADPWALGMAEYFNRLIVSALAVLFLQTFNPARKMPERNDGVEILLAALLLNILFLVKISGLIIGFGIVLAGCLLPGRVLDRLRNLGAVLLLFAAMVGIEFMAAGLEPAPIFHVYALAAQGRLEYPDKSFLQAVLNWPTLSAIALLLLFGVSRQSTEQQPGPWWIALVIGSYAAAQIALSLTNSQGTMISLAPVAAAALAGSRGRRRPAVQEATDTVRSWRAFHPARLSELSSRDAIPLVLFILVIVPQIAGSVAGVVTGASVALGFRTPVIVTAGTGLSFSTLGPGRAPDEYAVSLNHGVRALSALNIKREKIATLDFSNPFPLLFRAPSPKGIYTTSTVGIARPTGWQDLVGDACIVALPMRPGSPEDAALWAGVARKGLADEFDLVHQDEWWKIYRRKANCP